MEAGVRSPSFIRVALVTALLTAGLIVFGAVVRVTDSGLGCGNDWPLCDGRLIPPLDNLTAWIEWLHRLFALLIGLFGIGMLALAIRAYRRQNQIVLQATVVAAVLFAVQSALGAMVVIFDLPPTMVTLHLGTAMLLLGALLVAVVSAWYRPARQATSRPDQVLVLAYCTTALSLLIILTGALVRGSGATLACLDWPLCNGELLPFRQGQLQTVHMLHRFAVGGLGIALVLLVRFVWNERTGFARNLAVGALAVYIMQALVGALFVWTEAAPEWGAMHVGLAAALWSLLVALCAVETLDQRPAEIKTQWKPSSETVLN